MCAQQSIKLIPLFSFMAWLTPWDYASSAICHTKFVKMPPKRNPSISTPVTEMNLDNIRKVIREELKAYISEEMHDLIRDEMKAVIRDEVGRRLDALEREINVIADPNRTLNPSISPVVVFYRSPYHYQPHWNHSYWSCHANPGLVYALAQMRPNYPRS